MNMHMKSLLAAAALPAVLLSAAAPASAMVRQPVAPQQSYIQPLQHDGERGSSWNVATLVLWGSGSKPENLSWRVTGGEAGWISAPGAVPYPSNCIKCNDSVALYVNTPPHAPGGTYTVDFTVTATAAGDRPGTVVLPLTFTVTGRR
jgi:opacity protein-like surface antigen